MGLVRHGGFVPWDDDLDLAIRAGDIPAFLKAMDDLPDHLSVRAKPQEHNPTYQVIDTRTHIVGAATDDGDSIFVDVVPMMHWRSIYTKKLDTVFVNLSNLDARHRRKTFWKRFFSQLGLPAAARWVHQRMLYPMFIHHDAVCRAEASGIVTAAFGRKWIGKYEYDVVFPLQRVSFCGVSVFIPNDPHRFLVRRYGKKYMIPLNENARWRHFKSASQVRHP